MVAGTVAILTDDRGRVVATAACFDRCPAAGISDKSYQNATAGERLARAAMRAMCHDDIAAVLSSYECERIINDLRSQKNYHSTLVRIGDEE